MKLIEAMTKYEKYVKVTKSEGTYNYLQGKKGIILRYLGSEDCEDIDRDTILDFIIAQQDRNYNISNRTINKYIQTIQQVLRYSCDIDLTYEKLPVTKKIIQIVPEPVILRIFNYYKSNQHNLILQRNYIMFRLFYETGLRLTELLNLKVKDFDFMNLTIHVKKTKTNTERYVFFSKETSLLLNRYILSSQLDNYIFIDFATGEILKHYTIESICQRLSRKLKIDQSISPHKWRHTFATRFITKNGNMEVLRQIMGHSSLKTTQKYLHINKETLHKEYFKTY